MGAAEILGNLDDLFGLRSGGVDVCGADLGCDAVEGSEDLVAYVKNGFNLVFYFRSDLETDAVVLARCIELILSAHMMCQKYIAIYVFYDIRIRSRRRGRHFTLSDRPCKPGGVVTED